MRQKSLLLFALAILLPTTIRAEVWQDPETYVNYEYTLGSVEACVKAGTSSVQAGSPNISGNITILSKFTVDGNEYTVTSIGEYAFSNSWMTGVNIPTSITTINEYAFSQCHDLTNLDIPSSVTSIGKGAFAYCGNWCQIL